METNERIIDFIKSKGLSISSFEKSIGKATNYIRNSKSFTSNVLSTIMDVYPDLNIEWLITGKGDMLKGEEGKTSSVEEQSVPPPAPITNERLLSIIESQQRTIENLSKK